MSTLSALSLLLALVAPPDWSGRYTFFESFDEGAGFWGYELTLEPDGDGYVGTLHIDGTQTMSRYAVRGGFLYDGPEEDRGESLDVIFGGYEPENVFEPFERGVVLFSLAQEDGGVIRTVWGAMEPRVADPTLSGVAFERE